MKIQYWENRPLPAPLSVLCDLRPAFDGHYGIPTETRLMFSLLHKIPDIQPTGLINHPTNVLARTFRQGRSLDGLSPDVRVRRSSRLAASTTRSHARWTEIGRKAVDRARLAQLHAQTKLGVSTSLDHFDGADFGDFLWQSLFSRSLSPSEFELCRTAKYAALWAPWRALHSTALLPGPRKYIRVDTSGYDAVIAQTPWPAMVSPRTRLIVRYHDSMPVFLPHTVKESRLHQFFHMSALSENVKSAFFACVSEFSRTQLLQIFPEIERRTFVVHDCLAEDYFPPTETRGSIADVILSRIDPSTTPDAVRAARRTVLGSSPTDGFRYLMAVGTLEPRKNYLGLFKAWEKLRMLPNRPAGIVLVGSAGWSNADLIATMRQWQSRGELFHISSVPPSDMRSLYASADGVICPSVSEGFDLPSVEALRSGAVVVASDIPVHREILGDAALYFNPYSPDDMAETIAPLLGNAKARQKLRHRIEQQAAKFDSSVVKDQWARALDSCMKLRPPG